jgi:hypothetical protein
MIKQVDLVSDGIIGRDFLQQTQAKIYYNSNTVGLKVQNHEWKKRIGDMKTAKENNN